MSECCCRCHDIARFAHCRRLPHAVLVTQSVRLFRAKGLRPINMQVWGRRRFAGFADCARIAEIHLHSADVVRGDKE